ncbi:(d)CMP kinase [Clostridium algidicarnis]|uniref:Cytidylate kinase n=1 Tax=Clostridium algidicarnis TaxID=37659 RepID=A0ABS6C3Z9_9CLOT|nr:(d)CMP kinase [Clostridium algidicarnis]MBU3220132.1 (d)CMP kinase [Clostridium algidicarnis]MCB2285763.1 (d)CMP kinase [Clostridium algidicarnis]
MVLRLSVAIDGPAGAGKSTIAKLIAKKFNLMYINTGAMYRAVTLTAITNNISSKDTKTLCNLIDTMDMNFKNDRLILNGKDIEDEITHPNISKNVSEFAALPEVRQMLVKLQQDMSKQYDVIMDGRDIGTVVLKNSPFKFFLTASPSERAKRRYIELTNKGLSVKYDDILEDILKRDYLDTTRESDPLKKAEDAIEIDTTGLDIDGVVNKISQYIKF